MPLEEQDASLWDAGLMAEAERTLRLASRRLTLRRFQIGAAIKAAHSARRGGPTDRPAILLLYEGLVLVGPTIGALTGLAVAVAEAHGPAAGLAALDVVDPGRRWSYQPWWAARPSRGGGRPHGAGRRGVRPRGRALGGPGRAGLPPGAAGRLRDG